MKEISIEIHNANYWETMKYEKELAQIYGANHPKRLRLAEESNKILEKIKKLKENDKEINT